MGTWKRVLRSPVLHMSSHRGHMFPGNLGPWEHRHTPTGVYQACMLLLVFFLAILKWTPGCWFKIILYFFWLFILLFMCSLPTPFLSVFHLLIHHLWCKIADLFSKGAAFYYVRHMINVIMAWDSCTFQSLNPLLLADNWRHAAFTHHSIVNVQSRSCLPKQPVWRFHKRLWWALSDLPLLS